MRHVAEGTLRRFQDEPETVELDERRHVAGCPQCRVRLQQIGQDAQAAGRLLAVSDVAPDTAFALRRLQQRINETAAARPLSVQERFFRMISQPRGSQGMSRLVKPLGGLAAGAALAGALAFTPAGALAGNFLTVFEPTQVKAVVINPSDFKSLPDLANYGSIKAPAKAAGQHFTTAAAAAATAGMPVLTPKALPAGVPATPTYEVLPGTSGSFTFSAAKAKAAAAAQGQPLPPMPTNLDGATLQVSTGTALVEVYADTSKLKAAEAGSSAGASGGATGGTASSLAAAAQAAGPTLIVGEMKAPRVTMSGTTATVAELESYLESQPGISASLKQAISDLGDPTTTLPIPVPISTAAAQNITLQDGTSAAVIGDSTGLAGGIIWEKGGIVYGVAGTLTQSQLISLANGINS